MKHALSGSLAIHKINYNAKMLTAQHLRIGDEQWMLQYFLVRYDITDIVLGKEMIDDEIMWLGDSIVPTDRQLGKVIEQETKIVLPVNPDPFSEVIRAAGEFSQFNIDSIAVERVRLVTCDVTTSYYIFRVEDDTVYRLACFWFTLVNRKLWYPLMPMDPVDIYHISDMLMEYESGKHEMWCRMNDSLVEFLQFLEKGNDGNA